MTEFNWKLWVQWTKTITVNVEFPHPFKRWCPEKIVVGPTQENTKHTVDAILRQKYTIHHNFVNMQYNTIIIQRKTA